MFNWTVQHVAWILKFNLASTSYVIPTARKLILVMNFALR